MKENKRRLTIHGAEINSFVTLAEAGHQMIQTVKFSMRYGYTAPNPGTPQVFSLHENFD